MMRPRTALYIGAAVVAGVVVLKALKPILAGLKTSAGLPSLPQTSDQAAASKAVSGGGASGSW